MRYFFVKATILSSEYDYLITTICDCVLGNNDISWFVRSWRYQAKLGGCVLLTSDGIRSQRPRDTSFLVGYGYCRLSNCKLEDFMESRIKRKYRMMNDDQYRARDNAKWLTDRCICLIYQLQFWKSLLRFVPANYSRYTAGTSFLFLLRRQLTSTKCVTASGQPNVNLFAC